MLSFTLFLVLSTIVTLCSSRNNTNTTAYEALYQLHSNSTPIFNNVTGKSTNPLVIALLQTANNSLEQRSTSDQPAGVCAPGSPCTNGACCSNTGVCSYAPSSC